MKNKMISLAVVLCGSVCVVQAQSIIENRSTLNALLISQRVDEDFEKNGITGGSGQAFGSGSRLSSTNLWAGSGANLVEPGVTISGGYVDDPENMWLEWNGSNIAGSVTRTTFTSYTANIDFWNPTLAFGLDLKDYPGFRMHLVAGVTVYGADDVTVLYQNNALAITDPANGLFFGFHHPFGGIGSVSIATISGDLNESPLLDNLTFTTAPIPEPSTVALGLLGLTALALRCRFPKM